MNEKTKLSKIFAVIMLLTLTATITFATEVQGLIIDIPTFLFVTASPDPVGVGQIVYVGITFSKPPPTSSGATGDLFEDITLKITDPDGTTTTYGPYLGSQAAGVTFSFTPDKVGNYSIQAFYPGQVLTGTNPLNPTTIGNNNKQLIGSTMLPSESNIKILVVQEEAVGPIYQTPPLPTEFWTRPIYATNWLWGDLASNWFGLGGSGGYDAVGNVLPAGTAPNSAHIVWTEPTQWGGQPGAPIGSDSSTAYSSVSLIQTYFKPTCILNGILFYNVYDGSPASNLLGWKAINVHTGEVVWEKSAGVTGKETIAWGQIVNYNNYQEFGSNAILYSSPSSGGTFAAAGTWMGIYDANTGNFLANATSVISTSKLVDYDADTGGAIVGYYTSGGNLCMYNYTNWITTGTFIRISGNIDASADRMVAWKTELPTTLNGDTISLSIGAVTPEVILMRQVPNAVSWQSMTMGYHYVAGYDAKTGAKLWGPINQTLPKYEDAGILCAGEGYYVIHDKDTNRLWGYSLTTGQLVWGPLTLQGGGDSSVWRDGEIAYGKVYIWDLGGYVNAVDLETGDVAWTYYAGDAGYDTPFESYPIFGYNAHSIADGKLFLSEGIMYTPPLHPSYRLAINCTDGNLVWKALQYSSTCVGIVGDGYFISWNSFDNQIYSFGKGPTDTEVVASPKVSTQGTSVLVEGTVMDISGGTTQDVITTRFPDGLPAMSDDSMEAWMEYAYMQQIKPTDATGVEVVISVIDPNNNIYDIGTATSDASGSYSLLFTPEVPGAYTVIATFQGSESYYGSYAETHIGVDAAPEPTAEPTPIPDSIADMYLLPATAAIIIAIIVIGLAIILVLRKRP